jgi:hypothetical protein
MKKLIVFTAIMALLYPEMKAQSDVDALRYSLSNPLGVTARSMSLGGAVGALGADPGAILSNPSGLAQYKSNVFGISVGTISSTNTSTYLNNSSKANSFKATVPGANVVFTTRKFQNGNPKKTGWVNTNFAIGWNKTADFNRNIAYNGNNTQNSYLDGVADYVQGLDASLLDANQEQLDYGFYYFDNMFWYAYLIDSVSNGNYMGNYDNSQTNMKQSGRINTTGGMHELNLAYAANYEHKFYFGMGFNVHRVRYEETNAFTEVDNPASNLDWNSYTFNRDLQTSGYGFSGRIGATFIPNKNLRVGGTIHTSTIYNLNDVYSDQLSIVYDDNSSESLETVQGNFDYRIYSPMKYGLQAAYIFDKKGLITAEVERINYSTMSLFADNTSFDDVNTTIVNDYKNTVNLKLGGEYVFNEFRVRAGYVNIGNPLLESDAYSRQLITGGLGMQEKTWSFDFAVARDITKDNYVPYEVTGSSNNAAANNFGSNTFVLTVSTKF